MNDIIFKDCYGKEIGELIQIRDSLEYDVDGICNENMEYLLGTIQKVEEYNDKSEAFKLNITIETCTKHKDGVWFWPPEMIIAVA